MLFMKGFLNKYLMINKYFYMIASLTLSACGNDVVTNMPVSKANTIFEILTTQPRSDQKAFFVPILS